VKGLEHSTFELTSPPTEEYNCIAWAAGDTERWWWPQSGFWPVGVATQETLDAFAAAYGSLGYEVCQGGELEAGYEKIAIYELNGIPTHAARQLADGSWTSKLGALEDVQHPQDGLKVEDYGPPVLHLKRRHR
jgi:hypothetical protein